MKPQFTIVTPSFRSAKWLPLCIASVADQTGVTLEHIVQDSCSDDGTEELLRHDSRVAAYIEKDAGMYDAVNRGLRRAQGQFLAYLNCDEQYLPGALEAVAAYFREHPHIDVLFSDVVIVDPAGDYICHRKVLLPLKEHSRVCSLPTFTCATFFRRRLIDELGLYFDPRWRDLGDVAWVLRLLDQRVPMGVLRRFVTAFTDTGENMNLKPNARKEFREMVQSAPWWARQSAPLLKIHHRLRRLIYGIYVQKPFAYSIYSLKSPQQRVPHQVDHPTFLWRSRL